MKLSNGFFLFVVLSATALFAADGKKKISFLNAKHADPDFAVQGEYEGTIGDKTKLGAQVIARGSGQFDAVLYEKGLPGAGWTGKLKVHLKGKTAEDVTKFTGKNFKGEIKNGEFSGTAEENVAFQLKKVERKSPTLGAKPPAGAHVLFDGSNVDSWKDGELEDEILLGFRTGVGTRTNTKFRDFTLHLEFRTPFMPFERGQYRGNSGMYLLDQYECQVLDSFGLSGEANECGGIYKIAKPKVNMCLPPLSWQTYDVDFQAARFNEAGEKTKNAVVTIRHNGVVIHDKLELSGITAGGGQKDEKPGSLYLQNHGDPVRYRNIWIIEK